MRSTMTDTTREAWLRGFIGAARAVFTKHGLTIPKKVRASIGFPAGGGRGTAIGECWDPSRSGDGYHEIFISPRLDGAMKISDTLTHELIHAALPAGAGHGRLFSQAARALGLQGKPTATYGGDNWRAWAAPIVKSLGPIPAAPLDIGEKPATSQTRLIRAECAECGFLFRTTRMWIDAVGALRCPDPGCGGAVTTGGAKNG